MTARNQPKKRWIQTHPMRYRFDPMRPDPRVIDIRDIAWHLAHLCRFTGAVSRFYSVAEHSVHVSRLCHPSEALPGLLHDGSEAYLNDISSPVKHTAGLAGYRRAEDRLQAAIYRKYGLEPGPYHSVKLADKRILGNEAATLKAPLHPDWTVAVEPYPEPFAIEAWNPTEARLAFLWRFEELTNTRVVDPDNLELTNGD